MIGMNRKHSKKRDAILRILRETSLHPSAQWIYDRLRLEMPGLSLGTVYRNLSLFYKEGTALRVGIVNGEERFDAITKPHPHIVCMECNSVFDLPFTEEAVFRSIAGNERDYTIDYRRTVFYGICPKCRVGALDCKVQLKAG
jgi:Fur family peroxide stress response transcriptional regulator